MSGVAATGLESLQPSAPQRLHFAPDLTIRAFALQRDAGNLLVYSMADTTAIRALGDVERQYLNHWHEAMFAPPEPPAPLFVHEADRPATAERMHVRATFSRRHVLDDDFEVIPTPGHTAGATAYLWDDGSHRHLFTGDTLYLRDGEWVAAVLGSSDRAAYLETLELIRELDFDVLVPWASSAGDPWFAWTDATDRRRRLDAVLARVRAGADG
jgi:glyoxylase-like metal-dependent hydrolase (beta-lactamase superfamily II)